MTCHCCQKPMRRINPEPESWIRWTPLYWCASCHRFVEDGGKSKAAEGAGEVTSPPAGR
jgi:hypothetical protein